MAIALGEPPDYDLVYEVFYSRFTNPVDIVNRRFTLTLGFDRDEVQCEASNLGEMEFELEEKLDRTDDPFKGIGTRNNNNYDGQFIVYFDDVDVRYK